MPPIRRGLINRDKLLELVDRLRVALPRNVVEADQVLEKRENIINQTLVEARRIKAAAEEEARARVQESEIIREAEEKAEGLVSQAREQARQILDDATTEAQARGEGADRYAHETLRKLEQELSHLLNAVRRGMDALEIERESAGG